MQSQFQFQPLIYTSINNDETASSNITKWLVLAKRQGLQLSAGYVNMSNTKIYDNLLAKTYCAIKAKKNQLWMSKRKNCRLKNVKKDHIS